MDRVHMCRDSFCSREISEPETEIEKWISVLEKCASTCFCLALPPALMLRRELILSRAHPNHSSELAAMEKARELLNIAAKAMVVPHHHLAVSRFRRGQNAIHP